MALSVFVQMRLNGEREKYFGRLLQRASSTVALGPEAASGASNRGAGIAYADSCGGSRCSITSSERAKDGTPSDAGPDAALLNDSSGEGGHSGARHHTGDARMLPPAAEGLDHVVRYIESFERPGRDIWLVFSDEGTSLHSLMYDHVALGAEAPGKGAPCCTMSTSRGSIMV